MKLNFSHLTFYKITGRNLVTETAALWHNFHCGYWSWICVVYVM